MTLVASDFAAWLKSDALYATANGAGVAIWGETAKDSTVITPLAELVDAQTEADYQAAFLSGPLAKDQVVVPGYRVDLIGQCLTITGDRLGYSGGADVFVIGAEESDGKNVTTLTVLKRL